VPEGPLDFGVQRKLLHYAANFALTHEAAAAAQVAAYRAVAGTGKVDLDRLDGIAQLGLLAFARFTRAFWPVLVRRGRKTDHLARPRDRASRRLVSMYPLR
jgi:hypothetical protein